jgi:hypothetical protein
MMVQISTSVIPAALCEALAKQGKHGGDPEKASGLAADLWIPDVGVCLRQTSGMTKNKGKVFFS